MVYFPIDARQHLFPYRAAEALRSKRGIGFLPKLGIVPEAGFISHFCFGLALLDSIYHVVT